MGRIRVRRAGLSRAVAVTAAAVVVAGLASTSNAGAAPASGKKAPGIKTSQAKLKGKTDGRLSQLPTGVPKKGKYSFLLSLDTQSTMKARQLAAPKGKSAARAAAKQQFGRIKSAQSRVVSDLPAKTNVVYKTHAVLAGVAVRTNVKNYAKLTRLAGVQAVYPIAPKSTSNSYAVPLQGGPQAWESAGDRGQNATVAIIDTGIDYTHKNFGGPGTVAAYNAAQAADQQANPTVFPTSKVVGGYDLVGDDYNADPTDPAYNPVTKPDNNPLDCEGHGSHVAGSAAGYGENSDGSTYTGSYDEDTPFDSLRIGPGVAPLAKLYAYRVFGCAGSTDVVGAAIDRAADPNQDGDTSDHVDVINMSLGSDFGSPQDADSVATDAASKLGIVMAVAAGNNGDLYDTGGSPGNAPRSLAVAATQDAQSIVDALNITAPAAAQYPAERSIAFDYSEGDLQGTVAQVKQTGNLDGCNPLNDTDKAAVNGKVAFVEWTDDDTARRCGSVARSTNLANAGAIGFIFADDQENFAAGITGSATIPGVLVAKSGGDAIRTQLQAGTTVVVGSTTRNGAKQDDETLNNTLADFSSRGSRGNLSGTDVVKPDVAAVGGTVFSTSSGTGDEGETESGTSMATPMTAGTAAIVRSLHPDWTAEQVKADIMNTAGQDVGVGSGGSGTKYAPNRVGTGRIDINYAANNKVLAYNADGSGAVSASFGPIEVTANQTLTKTIKVENTGNSAASYDVGYTARTSIPGADFSVSPASVDLDPRSSKTVTVTLTITKSQLTKTIDPTVARKQAGLFREYVADASGLLTLTDQANDNNELRVPVYAAPRPASTMTQPSSLAMPSGVNVQKATLPLSGGRINQGDATQGTKITSTVAGFELQATSGLAPTCSATVTTHCVHFADERSADLKYVGATSSAPQLQSIDEDPLDSSNGLAYFSVTTQGPWRSAVGFQDAEVYIDSTGDGKADVVTYTTRLTGTDILVAETVDLATGDVLDDQGINDRLGNTDTALFDSDTLVLPVTIGLLPGVTASKSRISYSVLTFSGLSSGPVDQVGDVTGDNTLVNPLTMDVLNPGVAVYGSYNGETSPLLYADSAGTVLQVRRDAAATRADGGLGALIVHFHNKVGNKAQPVFLKKGSAVPQLSISPSPAQAGKPFTATVTVPAAAGVTPTGTVAVRNVGTGGEIGRATLKNGTAKITYTPRGNGTVKYQASYSGDSNYFGGSSEQVTLVIKK